MKARAGSRFVRSVLIISATLVAGASGQQSTVSTAACSVEALNRRVTGTTITSAEIVAATSGAPEHCQVDVSVATPGNAVTVRVAFPATWNGKLYVEGVGGFGGSIPSLAAGLSRGYASASTDTGHQGAVTDATWAEGNPARVLDFAHRGTHAAAVTARALTTAYYGRAPRHAYFNGCSNGGRQALLEVQRYPDDFDGVIAGNPSFGTLGQVQRALIFQKMLSSPAHALAPDDVSTLARATLAACDAADGLTDGLVSNPRACRFRAESLACTSGSGADCLTAEQIETVTAIYADVEGPDGLRLYGFPPGHEDGRTGWPQWLTAAAAPTPGADGLLAFASPPLGFRFMQGFLRDLAFAGDRAFDWRTFTFERYRPRLASAIEPFSPTSADLRAFQRTGGKLIVYHGWADPALSASTTVAYYEQVLKATPDAEGFTKLFLAPGMHHCQGNGPGPNTFDMLSALEDWVERGNAPTRVIASHRTGTTVDRTRPLCPYPQVARYVGTGSIDAAGNFRCEAP